MKYLGHLSRHDPFYRYLRHDIFPMLNAKLEKSPDFRVYRLPASNHVYIYEECQSHVRIIGKFFGGATHLGPEGALDHMEREYNNLNYLRNIGFAGYPHYVVRPLGRNASLNHVLVEEYCYGTPLSDVIVKAITKGERSTLFQKLGALAYFLATLHNRTAGDSKVDFNKDCEYFDHILEHLCGAGRLGGGEAREFHKLREGWRAKSCMWDDRQTVVHNDVTPANILFGDGPWVIVIDLERMKLADRVLELGRVVGELQYYFLRHAGDRWLAEPFIGHFLWEYACHFPDRDAAFRSITHRVPFYAGLTLLRIARNSWLAHHYSRQLMDEAKKMLR
jgi:serine/threonine protein kinase